MERPQIAMSATVLGAPDARALGAFYRRLLGWEVVEDKPEWYRLQAAGGGAGLSFQYEPDHVPPAWPAGRHDQQMQLHLDLLVEDLEAASEHAVACGARRAESQPQDGVLVHVDPVGHPFCLFVADTDDA